MRKLIIMLAILLGFGLSCAYAQNSHLHNTKYYDTVVDNGNAIVRENIINELKAVPLPYNSKNINGERVVAAISNQKSFIAHTFETDYFFRDTEKTYSYSYNYLHEVWNEPKEINSIVHYEFTSFMIILISLLYLFIKLIKTDLISSTAISLFMGLFLTFMFLMVYNQMYEDSRYINIIPTVATIPNIIVIIEFFILIVLPGFLGYKPESKENIKTFE